MAMPEGETATELLRQLDAKQISAEEVAQDVVKREAAAAHLNAMVSFDADLLIQSAQHADRQRANGNVGPLCGLPLIVKDNINTTAFPTSGGTAALAGKTPKTNAGLITALEQAGGIIGGKAGMHELAFGVTSNNAVTGAIRNPHDPSKIPGGSSGGTAVAVSSGVFPAGLGTDTGASVRLPAALCGIVGFRPTVGRYPGDGIVPISHTRDTAGPLARSVADVALIDRILSNDAGPTKEVDLADVRLGIPQEVFFDDLDADVEAAVQSALNVLERAGVTLVDVSLADIWPLNEAVGFPVALYEVKRDLPAYLKEHAPGVSMEDLIAQIGSPDVAGVFASQSGSDAIPEALYRAAMEEHRPAMQALYRGAFASNTLTAIVFPTSPMCARPIGQDETVNLNGADVPTFPTFIRNTDLGSNIGVPGISLPCPDVPGMPIGIEFEGLSGADSDLIALAHAVETALTR